MFEYFWETFPGFNEWMLALGVPFAGMASALLLITVVGPSRVHGTARDRRERNLEATVGPSWSCPCIRRKPRGLARLVIEQEKNANLLKQRLASDDLDHQSVILEAASLSGQTWQVSANNRTTGADLRARIAEFMEAPKFEVVLLCGVDVITDAEAPLLTQPAAMHGPPPHIQVVRSRRQLALSGSSDGNLKLWKVGGDDLECIASLPGHKSRVNCLVVNWEQRCALSGSSDGFLKLWDIDSRCCIDTMGDVQSNIKCLSVDWIRRCALASDMTVLRLWDLENALCLATLRGHGTEIYAMGASWRNMLAFTGSFEGRLCMWNLQDRSLLAVSQEHLACVTCIVMDSNSWQALSGSNDGLLKKWDTQHLHCTLEMRAGWAELRSLAVDWPAQQAFSGSERGVLKHWDLRRGECLRILQGDSVGLFDGITSIQLDSSTLNAITGGTNGQVKLWHLGEEPRFIAEQATGSEVRCICLDAPEPTPAPDDDESQGSDVESDQEVAQAEHNEIAPSQSSTCASVEAADVSQQLVREAQNLDSSAQLETPQKELHSCTAKAEASREIVVHPRWPRRRWLAWSVGLAMVGVLAMAWRRRWKRC